MPLIIVVFGILLLFLLIAGLKLNAFLAFVIVSLFVGVAEGMNFIAVTQSIQNGIGNTLGYLILILGLGSMLGKLVADSGAAQRITSKLVEKFGRKNIQWALVLTGFIVGIPMFYTVGFVIFDPTGFYHGGKYRPALVICRSPNAGIAFGDSRVSSSSPRPDRHRRHVQRQYWKNPTLRYYYRHPSNRRGRPFILKND